MLKMIFKIGFHSNLNEEESKRKFINKVKIIDFCLKPQILQFSFDENKFLYFYSEFLKGYLFLGDNKIKKI